MQQERKEVHAFKIQISEICWRSKGDYFSTTGQINYG